MNIIEAVDQVVTLLQQRGRATYGVLKKLFALDDDALELLKEELLFLIQRLRRKAAVAWCGQVGKEPGNRKRIGASKISSQSLTPNPQPPAAYTPAHLAERIRAEQAALEARGATDGERKTITALFADLKGSTALIEGLDPEEARAIIDPALATDDGRRASL